MRPEHISSGFTGVFKHMIPTRIHGILDYVVGLALIAVGAGYFGLSTPEGAVPFGLGVATIIYSLLTRYELGVMPVVPMTGHLAIDAISGVFLAASPWILSFSDRVWMPHVALGVFELLAVALSSRTPMSIGVGKGSRLGHA
jgi:hypothetical protein